MKRPGFTLTEILIATSLFAMLMVGVINLFRSTGDSFNAGSWRLAKQKSAQIFLGRLKEALEKANNAESIPTNGIVSAISRPIFISNTWKDKSSVAADSEVMMFSICQPYREPQPMLNITAVRPGNWTGVVLNCKSRKLHLYRTGSINKLPPTAPPEVGSPDLAKFPEGFTAGNIDVDLDDVTSFTIRVASAAMDAGMAVSVIVEMTRFSNGQPTPVTVTESVTAALLHPDQKITGF